MFGSFHTDQSPTVPWPVRPLYRVASIFVNVVRSDEARRHAVRRLVAVRPLRRAGDVDHHAQAVQARRGTTSSSRSREPVRRVVAVRRRRRPRRRDRRPVGGRVDDRRPGGGRACQILLREPARTGTSCRRRIRSACASRPEPSAAGTASSATSATSAKRAVFCTGNPPPVVSLGERPRDRSEVRFDGVVKRRRASTLPSVGTARSSCRCPRSRVLLWLALGAALAAFTSKVADWFVMTDELLYERLAMSIARTHSPLPHVHRRGGLEHQPALSARDRAGVPPRRDPRTASTRRTC